MKKHWTCALCIGALLLAAACTPASPAVTPTPAPAPTPTPEAATPAPTPGAPVPRTQGAYDIPECPVTEEALRAYFAGEGYTVNAVTRWEDDYLAEISYGEQDYFKLYWIFGETGRTVQLTGLEQIVSYEILDQGSVNVHAAGTAGDTPWVEFSSIYTAYVLGGEHGFVDAAGYNDVGYTEETAWLDPAEPLYVGFCDIEESERCGQLYDARVDVDGLSFAFIPAGGDAERFRNFFTATTTISSFQTDFDPDTREFTIRFYNTCLESGGVSAEDLAWGGAERIYGGLYPYSFPAGRLGRDNYFLTGARVDQDGEDVVVTCTLTEKALSLTVEEGDLSNGAIPSFRILFREDAPNF